MCKLSIITINYNNREGLNKTMASVFAQTYMDYEYIIIDGGSTDGSVDVIKKNRGRISCWVSEKDGGIYNAQNKGLLKAKGKYCLFLNSGDFLIEAGILSKVFNADHSEDLLYGELVFDFEDGNKQLRKLPEQITLPYLFNGNIWHPASFIKRELFTKIGLFNEKYEIAADYDFFFHSIIVEKIRTRYLPFPISIYNTTGISSDSLNLKKINTERNLIHQSYLKNDEIDYLNNLNRFKSESFSKWLSNNSVTSKIINHLFKMILKIKNSYK
jgi:glycosyltransferase involved in cell wall biosynthesis